MLFSLLGWSHQSCLSATCQGAVITAARSQHPPTTWTTPPAPPAPRKFNNSRARASRSARNTGKITQKIFKAELRSASKDWTYLFDSFKVLYRLLKSIHRQKEPPKLWQTSNDDFSFARQRDWEEREGEMVTGSCNVPSLTILSVVCLSCNKTPKHSVTGGEMENETIRTVENGGCPGGNTSAYPHLLIKNWSSRLQKTQLLECEWSYGMGCLVLRGALCYRYVTFGTRTMYPV